MLASAALRFANESNHWDLPLGDEPNTEFQRPVVMLGALLACTGNAQVVRDRWLSVAPPFLCVQRIGEATLRERIAAPAPLSSLLFLLSVSFPRHPASVPRHESSAAFAACPSSSSKAWDGLLILGMVSSAPSCACSSRRFGAAVSNDILALFTVELSSSLALLGPVELAQGDRCSFVLRNQRNDREGAIQPRSTLVAAGDRPSFTLWDFGHAIIFAIVYTAK